MDEHNAVLNVRILGRAYTVACATGEEKALLDSAKRVDEEMRHIHASGNVLGTDRIAVMVALNLAHELLLLQQKMQTLQNHVQTGQTTELQNPATHEVQQQVKRLCQKVESALERYQ